MTSMHHLPMHACRPIQGHCLHCLTPAPHQLLPQGQLGGMLPLAAPGLPTTGVAMSHQQAEARRGVLSADMLLRSSPMAVHPDAAAHSAHTPVSSQRCRCCYSRPGMCCQSVLQDVECRAACKVS